jgi:hypothetical protein
MLASCEWWQKKALSILNSEKLIELVLDNGKGRYRLPKARGQNVKGTVL